MIINAPFIYYFDSYAYLLKAIDFSSSGTIQLGVGMPFVIFLGVLYFVFGSALGVILVSRLGMLLMSIVLVCVIYLFGLKLSGRLFGFLAALFAVFEPFFLSYSIVPHNDIFAVALGFAALYFALSNTISGYIVSPILFYLATFTRPEFYFVLIIPILSFLFLETVKTGSKQAIMRLVLTIMVYILPVVWLSSIYGAVTRFGIVERFTLFLKPGLLMETLNSAFRFYDQPFLNQALFILVAVGITLGLRNVLSRFIGFKKTGSTFLTVYKKVNSVGEVFTSYGMLVALYLSLVFVCHIVVVCVYGHGYTIVDGTLIISDWLPDRYLITSRLLMSYPLAYPLSIIVQKVCKIVRPN